MPDAAVERFVEERRTLIATKAEKARDAIQRVLADPKVRTHGLSYGQWSALAEAKAGLDSVLS